MGQSLARYRCNISELLEAASTGDTDFIRKELSSNPALVARRALISRQGILHSASETGRIDTLRIILELSSQHDPSKRLWKKMIAARNSDGYTPFLLACRGGHTVCAKWLLEQGANPLDVTRNRKETGLHQAAAGHVRTLTALLSSSICTGPNTAPQLLRNLLIEDSSGSYGWVDSQTIDGLTALHVAVQHDSLECVLALIEAGASLMVATGPTNWGVPTVRPGTTPLHMAARNGNIGIIQALLQAHVDAMGTWGDTPGGQRSSWEGNARLDLRAVRDSRDFLPYHEALSHNMWSVSQLLHPGLPILSAIDNAGATQEGLGPHKLSAMCALVHRRFLQTCLSGLQARIGEEANQGASPVKVENSLAADSATQQQEVDSAASAPRPGRTASAPHTTSMLNKLSSSVLPPERSLPSRRWRSTGGSVWERAMSKTLSLRTSIQSAIQSSLSSNECGICMDADAEVRIHICAHCLCISCAMQLCKENPKPPLCPFCRRYIDNFDLVTT
ncbi:probable E3 ubiquitin-protein ligase XBAT31 at N-terminal half [Coccomyxa sp. Obi]|nr:probable E3 ubiquitin-protein ligase XBAT31 at N-terminal half [Coccomyxa sp. Obi]